MRAVVVLLALLAAFCMGLGIVIRQRATMQVPPDQGLTMTMMATLARNPLWWTGTAVALAGYTCHALALAYGSLLPRPLPSPGNRMKARRHYGLLNQLTRNVLETALNAKMSEHLG